MLQALQKNVLALDSKIGPGDGDSSPFDNDDGLFDDDNSSSNQDKVSSSYDNCHSSHDNGTENKNWNKDNDKIPADDYHNYNKSIHASYSKSANDNGLATDTLAQSTPFPWFSFAHDTPLSSLPPHPVSVLL